MSRVHSAASQLHTHRAAGPAVLDLIESEEWRGTKRQREALRQKFGGRCAYCGGDLSGGMHCDHLEPVVRYNPSQWDPAAPKGIQMVRPERNVVANMMPACKGCNLHKGGYSLESWRTYIQRSAEIVRKQTSTFRAGERFGVITVSDAPVTFYFERLATTPAEADAVGMEAEGRNAPLQPPETPEGREERS